jgi:hypothetical protein
MTAMVVAPLAEREKNGVASGCFQSQFGLIAALGL